MLSINECRNIIGDQSDLSDNEIEALRDQLYALASVSMDAYSQIGPTSDRTRHSAIYSDSKSTPILN
jgi:hypothetical protein